MEEQRVSLMDYFNGFNSATNELAVSEDPSIDEPVEKETLNGDIAGLLRDILTRVSDLEGLHIAPDKEVGLLDPKATPDEVVTKLNALISAFNKVLNLESV